ncbi:MAG: alpha/beta hydrolase [Vicinamibacterales bacterium]
MTRPASITRRRFGALAGSVLGSLAVGEACRAFVDPPDENAGRLTARPGATTTATAEAGTRTLGLGTGRDATLLVPEAASGPLPLLLLLHGASSSGARILQRVGTAVNAAGLVVLAPDSRDSTWDAVLGGFGPDVEFLNTALERVFSTIAIDPARVAVGGFSDGATYALSLGLINGDLFTKVVAFSPGFIVEGATHGKPRFFISHGATDTILPIDSASHVIVPALKRRGYDVTFREFSGGHEVPPAVAGEAMTWVAARA